MEKTARTERGLHAAVLENGETVFRICYLHTKRAEDTLTMMKDVFRQYAARKAPIDDSAARRAWILKAAHRTAMDYYAEKLRKKPRPAAVARRAERLGFPTAKEFTDILTLHYTYLTPLALCRCEDESVETAARVTGRPVFLTERRLKAAETKTGLSEQELREWLEPVIVPEEMLSRVLYDLSEELKKSDFGMQSRAAAFRRGVRRGAPFAAFAVLLFCAGAAIFSAHRAAMYEEVASSPYLESGETSGTISTGAPAQTDPPDGGETSLSGEVAYLSASIFVPDETGLVEYVLPKTEADAGKLIEALAAHGAFPETVRLEGVSYFVNGERTETVQRGDPVEAHFSFSPELQEFLDGAESLAALEGTVRSLRSFYEAANLTLAEVEIYSGGAPVSSGGRQLNCTALLSGELPVTAVIEE